MSFAALWRSVVISVFVFVFAILPAALFAYATGDLADLEIETSNVFENEWKSSVELAADGSYRLSWNNYEHRIVFLVEVKTRGYFELGLSHSGRASEADIAVGWVNNEYGKAHLLDCHGDKASLIPIKDNVQNYELLNGFQNITHTVLMFTRLWNTCDKYQDVAIGNDTIKLLWAFNDGDDPFGDSISNIVWHDKEVRGKRSLNLKNPSSSKRQLKGIKHLDLKLSDVSYNTTSAFWCQMFKQPLPNVKHHIIGYEPILEKNDSEQIRRMILYECQDKQYSVNRSPSERKFPCHHPNRVDDVKQCSTPVVVWAAGSEGEFFPKHVGLPFGDDPKQYYMLEIHYYNPSAKNVINTSGLRLYHTDQLRKHDGGVLVTGAMISPFNIIPPYQESYKMAGCCDKYSTKSTMPLNGINSISVVLHSHSLAREMRLRHFRQGEELIPIVQDKHYDYNYQQARELPREVTIFPEDELVTECSYNTINLTYPIRSGYSMKQETCLAYITYYPKIPLTSCQSMTPIKHFFDHFGVKKFYDYDLDNIDKAFSIIIGEIPDDTKDNMTDESIRLKKIMKLIQSDDRESEESKFFRNLVISESKEFQNKTFSQHLLDLPWRGIDKTVEGLFYYNGTHKTFCRLNNNSLAMPASEYYFPKIKELKVPNEDSLQTCKKLTTKGEKTNDSSKLVINLFPILLFVTHILRFFSS